MERKTMRKHVVTYSSLLVIAITLLVCFSARNNYTFVLKANFSSFLNIGLNFNSKLMLRVLFVSIDNTNSALLHASLQMQ